MRRAMVHRWCETCGKRVAAETNEANGFTCCTTCGKILDERAAFSADATFVKNAQGASVPDGHYVPESGVAHGVIRATRGGRLYGVQLDSHERTLYLGKLEIKQLADRLGIRPREDVVDAAHRLYKLAVQRNFTRGRRISQVAGACMYIICRQESRPYMLIDFADILQTNVYVLGGVFLQLCRLLRLEQHPLMQKPIDPSLFIHRFADKLNLGRRMHTVANTALRLVASMKRDWMQTGRRPNGICGAALWVAAQIHGFSPSKRDVVAVVHVGESTLKKRLSEFENTPSAALSIEEFDTQARTFEAEEEANKNTKSLASSPMSVLSCVHKDNENIPHFAHGMCRACYVDYVRISGGSVGGADPPAFMRAEAKRKIDAKQKLLLPALSSGELGDEDALTQEFNSALEQDLSALLASPTPLNSVQPLALPCSSKRAISARNMTKKGQKQQQQHHVQTSRREPVDADFLRRAEDALRLLVGSRWAELVCLPFTSDLSKARLSKMHMCELHPNYETFVNNEGERIAQVDALVLHFLIAAKCFDDSALAQLAKHSPHDVEAFQTTPFDPSQTSSKAALAVVESDGLVAKEDNEVIDTLSDVDDDEIDSYIHNENEVNLRRLVWSEMNKEYLEFQALKEQAASRTSAPTKKKHRKAPDTLPAETPAEAARQVLAKKKGSSKINYEALENLFKVSDGSQPPPNSKATSDVENDASPTKSPRTRRARPAGLPSSAPMSTKSTAKRRGSSVSTHAPSSARPSGLAKKPSAKKK